MWPPFLFFFYIYFDTFLKNKKFVRMAPLGHMGVAGHPHFGQGGGLATPKASFRGGRTIPMALGGGSATPKGQNEAG
jgi:hypothetical protein